MAINSAFSNSYVEEIASLPLAMECRGYCIIHKGRKLNIFHQEPQINKLYDLTTGVVTELSHLKLGSVLWAL